MPQIQNGHSVQLLQGGEAFFASLTQALDASRVEVRMETYIFNDDNSGQKVAAALSRASQRGVQVYLVVDGAGTPVLAKALADSLTAAKVQWRIFSPLVGLGWFFPSRWRRLHRKLCVVDGKVGFCGGINVLDDYIDPNHGILKAPRFDFSVRVTGPLVQDMHHAVVQFWLRQKAVTGVQERDFPSAWAALQSTVPIVNPLVFLQGSAVGANDPAPAGEAMTRAALVLRDNLLHRSRIERAYRKAIGDARREIIIANAYFVPGARLRRALIHAAQRGVRVRLLLQGKYEYFMQYHAARPVWGALLAAGVEIHEYEASFLHAKVAVIDNHWATVGSSNLDPLSLLLAREANVVVDDVAFATDLQARLDHAMQHGGDPLDAQEYADRPVHHQVLDRLAFGLMRLMLWLTGKNY
jgi:cardiolipin synthase